MNIKSSEFSALCKKHGLTEEQGKELLQLDDGGIVAYKGSKNPSKYKTEQIAAYAKALGFDPSKGNKEFQEFLYNYKAPDGTYKYRSLIDKAHTVQEGLGPNSAGKYNDALIGARYDMVFDQLKNDLATPAAEGDKPKAEGEKAGTNPYEPSNYVKPNSFLMMPDQTPLPPEGLIAHTKLQSRLDRLDPTTVSFDDSLREFARSQGLNEQQINQAPTTQQAALTSNLSATALDAISKVIGETTRFNAQQKQAADTTNLNQSNAEEAYRRSDISMYETNQLKALANTKNDFYNYFSTIQRNEINKYNYLTKFNMAQNLFENVAVDPVGNIVIDPRTGVPLLMYDYTQYKPSTTKTTTKSGDKTTTVTTK